LLWRSRAVAPGQAMMRCHQRVRQRVLPYGGRRLTPGDSITGGQRSGGLALPRINCGERRCPQRLSPQL